MGLKQFFQGLFSGTGAQGAGEEPEEESVESYTDLPSFYKGAPIDVISPDGATAFSGRLAAFALHELEIDRIPGDMSLPLLEVGSQVKIRGFSPEWQPYNLVATVLESTKVVCRVGNMEVVPYQNNRKDSRQPLKVRAAIYSLDDTRLNRPNECLVEDIGLGGACVASAYQYDKGETLRLRVELMEKSGHESFISQVVRVTPLEDGIFEYGLLFAQMNQRQIGSLSRSIEDIRRAVQRKMEGKD